MNKLITVFFLALALTAAAQYEHLRINNVNYSWNYDQGSIDTILFEVKPKGIYTEIGMYLNFSTRGTGYSYYDSLEVEMLFNLPPDAEVTDMQLWIADSAVPAYIIDRWTASQIYEDIVDRRTDPAILYKYEYSYWDYYYGNYITDNMYMFRIFPLLTSLPRKAKITYMIKNTDVMTSDPTFPLPLNILNLSNQSILKTEVRFIPPDNMDSPRMLENASIPFVQKTSPQLGTYYEACVSNYSSWSSMTLTCKNHQSQPVYLGSWNDVDHNENFYQLQIIPDQMFGLTKNKKALFLFDFQQGNCNSITSQQMLDQVEQKIRTQFRNYDSVNFIFSGYLSHYYSQSWISADSVHVTTAFNTMNSSWCSGYSNLPTLLTDGIAFIKNHKDMGTIILISSSGTYGSYQQANGLIQDFLNVMDTSQIPIHIIDMNDSYYPYYYIGGQYFYDNQYLYINLSMQTAGEYLTIRENDFQNMLSNIMSKLSGFFSNFDLYVALENGYTYSVFDLFAQSGLIYFDQPVQSIGKYDGTGRFRIIAHGQLPSGQIFSADLLLNNNLVVAGDAATRAMWAAQMIRELSSLGQSNTIISQMISTSIHERVLSDYTAFIALEPGIGPLITEENNWTSTVEEDSSQVHENSLFVYPNPFMNSTNISYSLNAFSNVCIEIFDLYGRMVSEVECGEKDAGNYNAVLQASGLKPGTYICRMVIDNKETIIKKITLLK